MIASMLLTSFFGVWRFGFSQKHALAVSFLRRRAGLVQERAAPGNLRAGFSGFALIALAGMTVFSPSRAADPEAASTAPSFKFDTHVEGKKLPDEIRAMLEETVELGKEQAAVAPTSLGQLRRRALDAAANPNERKTHREGKRG